MSSMKLLNTTTKTFRREIDWRQRFHQFIEMGKKTHWKNSSDGIFTFLAVSVRFLQTSMVTSLEKTQSSSSIMIPPAAVQFFESNLLQAGNIRKFYFDNVIPLTNNWITCIYICIKDIQEHNISLLRFKSFMSNVFLTTKGWLYSVYIIVGLDHDNVWSETNPSVSFTIFTLSVPPVITARPGKTWGEGGENVEEGPGQDDVVVAPNVQG